MDQMTFGLAPLPKQIRKDVFLDEMKLVEPWATLVALIQQHARASHLALGRRPPFSVGTRLHIHCLPLRWNLCDPAMEEELRERQLFRRFVGLDGAARMPDANTILRLRHLLERHELAPQTRAINNAALAQHGLMLKTGTVEAATTIAANRSTKDKEGQRDTEMHQAKNGNQSHFGTKAHIRVNAESRPVRTVIETPAKVKDVTQAGALLHGEMTAAIGGVGYRGLGTCQEAREPTWFVAMQPGKRKTLDTTKRWAQLLERAEQVKASVRAKVEHLFRVVKPLFGHAKVLLRSDQEHRATESAVRAYQSEDGAAVAARNAGMSAPEAQRECVEGIQLDRSIQRDALNLPAYSAAPNSCRNSTAPRP